MITKDKIKEVAFKNGVDLFGYWSAKSLDWRYSDSKKFQTDFKF